jgi:hypothetical protein
MTVETKTMDASVSNEILCIFFIIEDNKSHPKLISMTAKKQKAWNRTSDMKLFIKLCVKTNTYEGGIKQ